MRVWPLVLVFTGAACAASATRDPPALADAQLPMVDASLPDAAVGQYSGDIIGSATPGEGTIIVGWFVSSANPEYRYKFGDGSSTAGHYTASVTGELPAAAFNSNGLAVGFFALVPKGSQFPDGKLDDTIDAIVIGVSRNGLVLRAAASQIPGWPAAFPGGELSCGRCVSGPNPSDPETMEPAPCSELSIDTSGVTHICNPF